jgi:methionine-gamma-lyase
MMGYGYDPFLSERSLKPPVFHTSTFVFRSAQDGKEFFELAYGLRQKRPNEKPGLIYSRINNPDLEMLEDRLAIWDQAEASLVFASGMAAISTTLWAYARPGTVIIHSGPVYGGTDFLLKKILPQFGVTSIGFLSEGGNRAMEEPSRRRAAKGRSRRFMSKRPQTPQMEWWISSMPGRSCPPSRVRTAIGRLSSLTIRCWDRSIRALWHMALIWSSRRLRNMSAVIPT